MEMTDTAACARCGIKRTVRPGDTTRSPYCRDCNAGNAEANRDRDWQDKAACTTVDPELFFPEPSVGWAPKKHANQICAS